MAQDTGVPALLPILQGPEAAPFEHLYRAALDALSEVMQQARAIYWQTALLAMLEEWDQTREVSRFRAAGRGLADLIIHPANFPALTAVQAAWLDRCLDLLIATAQTCLDVVRPPELPALSGLNAYQIEVMQHHQARLREQVAHAQTAAQGAAATPDTPDTPDMPDTPETPGKPLEVAFWDKVIDRHGRVRELHSLHGSRCPVCWRRFVLPADVAFAAASRWLRPRMPGALVQGHGRQLVMRAAACEQDAACRRAQRALQAAVARYRPVVLQAQEDAAVCPHCGTRCNAEGLRWDLVERPLRLRERPAPSS
jgi:hypothetical protein